MWPAPLPKVKALAEPVPAPPTPAPTRTPTTNEPPVLPKQAPAIFESRTRGGLYPAQATEAAPGRCKVGFWNITGRDLTLTINGQARTLPKDRAVTVELERNFVWQITGRDPHSERVPEEMSVFEVILRP